MRLTGARGYYNYKVGKKYDAESVYLHLKKKTGDPEKAKSAYIFYNK